MADEVNQAHTPEVVVVNGEAFAYFRWHCLKWPGISAPPMRPCEFKAGWMCADMWRNGERK